METKSDHCTVRYNGHSYEIAEDIAVVWSVIADRLNSAAARRDNNESRPHGDAVAADGEIADFGEAMQPRDYDPFVVLPLADDSGSHAVLIVHVHDSMDIAITGDGTTSGLRPTTPDEGNVS